MMVEQNFYDELGHEKKEKNIWLDWVQIVIPEA